MDRLSDENVSGESGISHKQKLNITVGCMKRNGLEALNFQ